MTGNTLTLNPMTGTNAYANGAYGTTQPGFWGSSFGGNTPPVFGTQAFQTQVPMNQLNPFTSSLIQQQPGPAVSRHHRGPVGDQPHPLRAMDPQLPPARRDGPDARHVQELQLLGVQQHPTGAGLLQLRQQTGELGFQAGRRRVIELAPKLQNNRGSRLIESNH